MKDQPTHHSRPYPRRLPPVPDQPAQPVPQPSVAFLESGTWAVLLGRECLASGFPRYRRLGTISTDARSIACATLGMARVASANAPQCPWEDGCAKMHFLYGFRLIRPGCLAWATSGSLFRV